MSEPDDLVCFSNQVQVCAARIRPRPGVPLIIEACSERCLHTALSYLSLAKFEDRKPATVKNRRVIRSTRRVHFKLRSDLLTMLVDSRRPAV